MVQLFPYLLFDGACGEALRFYERLFQGRIEVLSIVGESPMAGQFPASSAHRVIHGRLKIGQSTLMASDWMASDPYPGVRGVRLMLTYANAETVTQAFDALAKGGRVEMALHATPFARAYGTLTDRFGVPWQLMVE
ncbi:MAG TPA: VOC family protein [Steroidobacteraceae bacterium]|nr:VOC family protein [Steroidobacteraceae bacterium]